MVGFILGKQSFKTQFFTDVVKRQQGRIPLTQGEKVGWVIHWQELTPTPDAPWTIGNHFRRQGDVYPIVVRQDRRRATGAEGLRQRGIKLRAANRTHEVITGCCH